MSIRTLRHLLPVLLLLAAPAAARETIGVYKGWGAFRDAAPARCYAIARPARAGGRGDGWASVATWPGRPLRASLHVRLSRAWAADAPSDRAIVAALRSGRSMSIEALAPGGAPFADVYLLAGAATAIDAAGLGCVGR